MHGVTESRPVTVRMEARPWRSGNKTTEWATKLALTRSAFSWKGRSTRGIDMTSRQQTAIGRRRTFWSRRVLRPYAPHTGALAARDPDDRVDVIRHHHEFIDRRRPAITTYGQQRQLDGPPGPHVVEYDCAFMGADRDEIRSRTAVIERWEADGTSVMRTGIEPHSTREISGACCQSPRGI